MRSVGKQARDESGKYPVNEDDEEFLTRVRTTLVAHRYGSSEVPIHSMDGLLRRCAPLRKRFAYAAGNDGSYACAKM
jgi:hypothetical protein